MKVSLNWLNDYLDIKRLSPKAIAAALTDIGLEVEAITTSSKIQGEVVVGSIITAEQHPDADKLRLCSVDVGTGVPLNIVCGAANARAGIKACVAKVGSTLPGDFKIKKSKIRGVLSEGMMCAADELGIAGGDHDGIIEVDASIAVGTSVAELYKLNDTVFMLSITPNRGDCLGMIGIARDLGAKLGIPLRLPQFSISPSKPTSSLLNIHVDSASDCPRFSLWQITPLVVAPSPTWLQERLQACDIRPINNIVDVTNYVMLEYSQPIHAYDTRRIDSNEIGIRRARTGETLKTLDGLARVLSSEDLVIADSERAIALAGIMGGENSQIEADTTSIYLEVANFDPRLVRKSAKRLALHTDASHRFERGCDVSACLRVAERVIALLQQIAAESSASTASSIEATLIADIYPTQAPIRQIALRVNRTRQILGLPVLESAPIVEKLTALGLTLIDQTSDRQRLLFQVPPWRHDLTREIDLVEEVGRLIGYDQITYQMPSVEMSALNEHPLISFIDRAKKNFAHLGFTEIISFPFHGDTELTQMGIDESHSFFQTVCLANPLAENEQRMRSSMLIGILKAVCDNRRAGQRGVRLFECGRVFFKPKAISSEQTPSTRFSEQIQRQGLHMSRQALTEHRVLEMNMLAAVIDQPASEKTWQNHIAEAADFFLAKSLVSEFLGSYALRDLEFAPIASDDLPYLHPGASAYVKVRNRLVGYIGELHPECTLRWGLASPPMLIEICLDDFFGASKIPLKIKTSEHRFPPLSLDLAFVVDRTKNYADFLVAFKSFKNRRFLRDYQLFDVYEGASLGADKKSMAFALNFSSDKRTLNDKDVEPELTALKQWFQSTLGAEVRS
jgi:phenylalanyl-tRNA synthetase beta chain